MKGDGKNAEKEKESGEEGWRRGEHSRGGGRPRYTETLAIFSSMHTSTGTSRMHSARCIPRAAPQSAARNGGHETMKNARATIYYLRVQVTTAEQAQSLSLSLYLSFSLSSLFLFLPSPPLGLSLMRSPPARARLVGNSERAAQ